MTINDQIRDEKLQYDINREASKISALSPGNIHKEEVKITKKYSYDSENTPFISKQKGIFNELVDERLGKITNLDKRVNSGDLIYRYKGNTADSKFDEFDNGLGIINKIRDGITDLADLKNNQQQSKSFLGKKMKKLIEQKSTLYNIEMLYKGRNEAIKFYDDYSLMMSEAKVKATKDQVLKFYHQNKCFKDYQ